LSEQIWGIHASKHGEAEALFLDQSHVALGWSKIGDPANFKGDREELKAAVTNAYPEAKSRVVPVYAGWSFGSCMR
jgi:predicted Mrr-cat superfamily restriction endonuclease